MKNILKTAGTALLILAAFVSGVLLIDGWAAREGRQALKSELTMAAAHCYAVEGRYPPDLTYIRKHYGIRTQHRRYKVEYRRTAPDRAPTIEITLKRGGAFA